jgi:ATP-dependent Clp protease protease subunit
MISHKLLSFILPSAQRTRSVVNAAGEILIYDMIDPYFGVSAADVLEQLAQSRGDITVRINSPGGDVTEGIAIYNALQRYNRGKVTIAIDGLAASIASYIALAGKRVIMASNALYMIHLPWTVAIGNADDLRKMADLLELTFESTMLPDYVKASKQPAAQIAAWCESETWFDAQGAKEAGFVHEIANAPEQPVDAARKAALQAAFPNQFKSAAPGAPAVGRAKPRVDTVIIKEQSREFKSQ